MTPEHNLLEIELMERAMDRTLTEARYNEILDALFTEMPDIPEATATLKALGRPEWQQRRYERLKRTPSAA